MIFEVIHHPAPESIKQFANLRTPKEDGYFIAESEKIVTTLLESGIEIISLYLTQEHFHLKKDLIEAHVQQIECKVFIGSKEEMDTIVGFKLHQNILASAKIPLEKSLTELIAKSKKPQLYVILDEVTDAENMGAIIRTSLALGATAVIIDKKSNSPWMRRAVRVSMGAIFLLPVVTVESISDCINELRSAGITTFASTLNENTIPIWDCDLKKDVAIIFGSESHGIKQEIIDLCEAELTIPMPDNIDSLNVGIAQGIFLYEVMRQRVE